MSEQDKLYTLRFLRDALRDISLADVRLEMSFSQYKDSDMDNAIGESIANIRACIKALEERV